ncbi:MAG: hypothetical protein GY768_23420 [Planctomycetaceae bacterium]|nr:hypothetical protein [Planctomycetaceae bacterium]
MIANRPPALNLQGLKDYIYQTLCEHEKLEIGVFPMTERVLRRRTEPCGIYFCLHGPRSVKFTAIWETDRNTVLFYGATGERFHKLRLPQAPALKVTESTN